MHLSKVFDTLNHGLLMAELEAHGFSKNSLNYIQSYLGNRLQRTNVNNNFSLWKDIFAVVPQGSILGPLMFNHSFLQGWNPPFSGYPLFLKQVKKFTPLFLRAIQIGACKLYETL